MILNGDLNQIFIQKRFLENNFYKFDSNLPPRLNEEESMGTPENALKLLWENKIEGWWNYKTHLIQFNICTEEEYWKELKRVK